CRLDAFRSRMAGSTPMASTCGNLRGDIRAEWLELVTVAAEAELMSAPRPRRGDRSRFACGCCRRSSRHRCAGLVYTPITPRRPRINCCSILLTRVHRETKPRLPETKTRRGALP